MPSLRSVRARARATVRVGFIAAILSVLVFPAAGAAQGTGRIAGTVTDSTSARPVVAAQVTLAGTRLRATTDDAGQYSIAGVPAGTYTVEVRRIGYTRGTRIGVSVTDGGTTTLDFALNSTPLSLAAVVTTGVVDPTAGTRVPFTVGRVDAAQAPIPASNAVETIQGRVAGVTVVPSGQPGSGTNIMLRTPTSIIKENTPLIVVDGVILSQSFAASTADLESMDIESIEVVKGAAAASLYGSRAQAGVIQIRTKRGGGVADAATRVTARTEMGNNALAGEIDWAQHHYYRTDASGQFVDAAGVPLAPGAARVARPAHERFQDVAYAGPLYDQVDRFYTPGNFYKNSIGVSQNTGRTNWFLSYVNSKEDGVVLNAGAYQQNDMRINLDHRMRDNLTSGVQRLSQPIAAAGAVRRHVLRPHQPGARHRSCCSLIRMARRTRTSSTPKVVRKTRSTYWPPKTNQRRRNRTQGSIEARWTPLSWLTFDANTSYDRSDRRLDFFLDAGLKTEGFGTGGLGEISQTTGTTDAINARSARTCSAAAARSRCAAHCARSWSARRTQVTDGVGRTTRCARRAQPGQRPGPASPSRPSRRFVPTATSRRSAPTRTASTSPIGLFRRDGSSLFGPEEDWNSVLPRERRVPRVAGAVVAAADVLRVQAARIARHGRRTSGLRGPVRDVRLRHRAAAW